MQSKISVFVIVVLLILSGCSSNSSLSGNQTIIGLAMIESIEILILESFPVQVNVRISGILGDSCTTLDQITQARVENVFEIKVTTTRPAEAICADIITKFEEVVALDVYGLPAGTYIVDVNGVRDTFTLSVSSFLSEPIGR